MNLILYDDLYHVYEEILTFQIFYPNTLFFFLIVFPIETFFFYSKFYYKEEKDRQERVAKRKEKKLYVKGLDISQLAPLKACKFS